MRSRFKTKLNVVGTLCTVTLLWGASPPDSPVADAAMVGDAEQVRVLLREGADVNAAQGDGMTALHWASELGLVEMVDVLIHGGANLEAVTRNGGYTPLHLASRTGSAEVMVSLLEAGSKVDARTTTSGSTPLHLAAASGSVDVVRALLDQGVVLNTAEFEWGQTPLMFAASKGRLGVVELLLARGADASVTTRVVDIPLKSAVDRAARQARNRVLEAFRIQEGGESGVWRANPNQVQAAVRAGREVQSSELVVAEEEEEDPLSEEFPGYTGLVGAQGGLTALLHAVREGYVETVATLLNYGADINQVSAGDRTSPILMATINGHFDLALLLLERGADPALASDAGATPLFTALNTHWAPKARYPQQQAYQQQQATYLDIMAAVLDAGVDPNVRLKKHLWYMSYTFDLLRVNLAGGTALWRAAYATDVDAMKLLVAYGADPNIPTVKPPERRRRGQNDEDPSGLPPIPVGGVGAWPIHAASGIGYGEGFAGNSHRHVPNGWMPTVMYLVEELGVAVDARDHNGYSALHHAAARGDNGLILYLVEQGADVTLVSRRGQTTVDMANGPFQRTQPFPQTIALLEGLGAKNNHNCVSC